MCALIALLFVGLIAGTYETNSLLAQKANRLDALKARTGALALEQINLRKAKKQIITYSGLRQVTQTIVPEDKDQAEAVREIVSLANKDHVPLSGISFPNSTLGSTSTPTSSTTSSSAASASSASVNRFSQLTQVKDIPGVYTLTITVQGDPNNMVTYSRFINFLSDLERNRRTAQVSTINITPNANDHSLLSFTLTLNEYIKP